MMEADELSNEITYRILNINYKKIKKLQKSDPEKNLHEKKDEEIDNHFATANDLIDESINILDKLLSENSEKSDSDNLRLLAMRITLLYERSKLLANNNMADKAEKILATSLDAISEFLLEKEVIYLALRIINHYAYLLTKNENLDKAKTILELGQSLYIDATKKDPLIKFVTSEDLFTSSSTTVLLSLASTNKLESLVTNNLQMLAVVYYKQGMTDKYAESRHEVLERQLKMKEDNPIIWATKSAEFAKQLLEENRFREARHHLAAAEMIFHDLEKNVQHKKPLESIMDSMFCDDFDKNFANLANTWVKYGLQLFSISKLNAVKHLQHKSNQVLEKIWVSPLSQPEAKPSSSSKINLEQDNEQDFKFEKVKKSRIPTRKPLTSIREEDNESCLFCEKELENENKKKQKKTDKETCKPEEPPLLFKSLYLKDYEAQVTADLIQDGEQARVLFNFIHDWLKRVRLYYSLENHPMEYINAIMDLSELYKYLAFYEEDIESQYTVHKLRADALETLSAVLREIRPHWYMAVSVELLRELAEVQLEMLGLNMRRIYAAQTSDPNDSSTVLKVQALGDLHSKLKEFGEGLQRDPSFTLE